MRYAYAITGALLLSGTAATMMFQPPASAQIAQNEPGAIAATVPRPGAPMSFADMVAKLQPAVVNISTKQTITIAQQANPFAGTPLGDLFGQMNGGGGAPVKRDGQALGSGFIISPDGYVVTNNHVVAPGAKGATVNSITVILADRKEYVAKLIGRDQDSDLALLKITAPGPLPFVKFGDSAKARPGDWVVAIGNPFGLGGTVTAGIVSAVHRATGLGAFDRFIQTDAAINQGNSGGPMFNLAGDVIGINSQILGSETGGNIGIGFAIPAEEAKPIIDKLRAGTAIKRGYLGVGLGGPVNDDVASALGIAKNEGEIISRVEPDGPAAKGGVKVGDVVTKVNGQPVTPDQTLSYLVANVQPGASVRLDVIRNSRPVALTVTAAVRPSPEELASLVGGDDDFGTDDDGSGSTIAPAGSNALGLTVQPLTAAIARSIGVDSTVQGLVIAQVDPASDAGGKLKRGDVVQSVNGVTVRTTAQFDAALTQAKSAGRPQVLLLVTRQKATNFIPIKFK